MTLRDYFDRIYRPQRLLGSRPATLAEYRSALTHWDRFAPDANLSTIDEAVLARFAEGLLPGRSPATVNKIVARKVLSILRHGGITPRWRKLRENRRQPVAFTADEFSRLLIATKSERGILGGLPAECWWESLLRSIWFSGARIGAMLAVRYADVLPEHSGFRVRAETQKQRADQWFAVDAETVTTWRRIARPQRELFWQRDCTMQTVHRHFRRLIAAAGLEVKGAKRFHRIRCSTASYIKRNGGNPTEQLGHSGPAVTRAYYDPRITGESSILRFMPPLS